MEDPRSVYNEKLMAIKEILEAMVDIENSFFYLQECENEDISNEMLWEIEGAEIKINDIFDDTYYITVCVTVMIEAKKGISKYCINYFYKISELNIERDLQITLDTPTFRDYGEKVLDELASILNSESLVLRKNSAR